MSQAVPGLVVLTPPANEPVSLADIRTQCRVDSFNTSDDDFLLGEITAARENIEHVWDRALVSRRLKLTLDRFPFDTVLYLPQPPLQTIESIKYVSLTGSLTTVDPATYRFDETTDPGRLVPAYGQFWPWFWPPSLREIKAVEITYVAGFGPVTTGDQVSAPGSATVTPANMMGIYVGTTFACDTGSNREWVTVSAVAATTFTATFTKAHGASFVINAVPRVYQSAIRILVFDKYNNRSDMPIAGATGLALPNGVQSLLQGAAHGEVF